MTMTDPSQSAVEWIRNHYQDHATIDGLCTALTAALAAQPQAEPVVPSDEQINTVISSHGTGGWQTPADMLKFARAVLALAAPADEITNYVKGIYAYLESVAPAGLATEAFRLPPSPTRAQAALFRSATGHEHSECAGLARQDQGNRPADREPVALAAPAVPTYACPEDEIDAVIGAFLPQAAINLSPCPFCGNKTPELERIGTNRQSCIVACGNCGCRHESSDEYMQCGSSWNERATAAQSADAVDAKRYRWLRRGQHWSVIDWTGDELRSEALDAAIDAALSRSAAAKAEPAEAGCAACGTGER
jgi:sarcosine oxidase delta subunit